MRLAVLLAVFWTASLLPAQDAKTVVPAQDEDTRDRVLFSEETERAGPLIKKEVRNILLDQKDIWTSPARINKKNAVWWVLIGGTTAGLIAADHHLSTQLPNTNDQTSFSRNVSQVGAAYTVLPLAAGFYAFGALKDDPKARETGALGLEALADAAITVAIMKSVFARERPMEGSGNGHFFRWGNDSFPSGHSMESFAFASILAHEYNSTPWVGVTAYGLAGLVSASRFSGRKHFAGDIIAGAGIGYFIGRYVFQTHADHQIHKRYRLGVKTGFQPVFDPGSRSYAVRLEFSPQR